MDLNQVSSIVASLFKISFLEVMPKDRFLHII